MREQIASRITYPWPHKCRVEHRLTLINLLFRKRNKVPAGCGPFIAAAGAAKSPRRVSGSTQGQGPHQ